MFPFSSAARDIHKGRHAIPYTVAELLPQSGRMMLLDRVLEIGESHIVAGLAVRDDGLFAGPGGAVPAWIGMEYMAQTVAAYSGYQRRRQGKAVDLGFLLGTRFYECSVSAFSPGTELMVRAEVDIETHNGMSVFDCRIKGENIRAAAKLNVFLPKDSSIYLAAKGV
jgi:predicted hotdog family 3-hydroxylacyl-ACP dehydratase